ncbi:MAG: hypothetical protein DI529_09125, partial [Chryseobacterium sp.]
MKIIKEILIWGGMSVAGFWILNSLFALFFWNYYEIWIYCDSLSGFTISLILLIVSCLLKKNDGKFDLFLRYSFSTFLILNVYNFLFFIKLKFGNTRFCLRESVQTEKLYELCFGSNFLIFVATLVFLMLFKHRNTNVFTKNSTIYIILVLILTVVFKAQILLQSLINAIFS